MSRTSKSDMAAKRIGDLLLKGHRMLDASCSECLTVLMQDRDGRNICVSCGGDGSPQVEPIINDQVSSTPTEVVMNELPSEVDVAFTSGINTVLQGVLEEMQHSVVMLQGLRWSPTHNPATMKDRQEVLLHLQNCAQVAKDLKSLKS